MNTLRILSLVVRASRIKQLIGKRLIALLLLTPVVASATCPPGAICILPSLNSGTMTVTDNGGTGLGSAEWAASGFGPIPFDGNPAGFTTSGQSGLVEVGLGFPERYGGQAFISMGDNTGDVLFMDLTIDGVPYHQSQGGGTRAFMQAGTLGPGTPITHAGTYFAFFFLHALFTGSPDPLSQWQISGEGNGSISVADFPGQPDMFYITGATFTFSIANAPEPSTASLLLIGFAGLAFVGRRRRSHTMIHAG